MRWVERYKNEGNVNIHYRKPVAYKVKKEYVKLLVDETNNNIKQLIITEQSKNSILISNAPDIHNIALSQSLNVYYKNAIKLDDFLVSLVLRNNIQV